MAAFHPWMTQPDTDRVNEKVFRFVFDKDRGERLDKFLVEQLPEFSRARLQGLIGTLCVLIDGVPARKSGQLVESGQEIVVRIPPTEPAELLPEKIPIQIIFENEDLLVINKPAGMVVHPAAGHSSGTLANAVLGYDPDMEGIGGQERPGVVHRLDKGTSGVILMAKNDRSLQWLQEQFRSRNTEKTYLALVDGHPPTPNGRIEAAVGRDPSHRKKMAVRSAGRGREAISEYKTLETFDDHTLLEFHPLTGRTHQVRLHCAFIGCPVVGDIVYGDKKMTIPMDRYFLHALRLKIRLPGQEQPQTFEAPLPDELQVILFALRHNR